MNSSGKLSPSARVSSGWFDLCRFLALARLSGFSVSPPLSNAPALAKQELDPVSAGTENTSRKISRGTAPGARAGGSPALMLYVVIQVLAFFPVWVWYAQRMQDPSDEPWGILALFTALAVIAEGAPIAPSSLSRRQSLTAPTAMMLIYACTTPFCPMLIRAIIAAASLSLTASFLRFHVRFHAGICGLLILSLPLLASLQFYLGYPLRFFTTILATLLLRLTGYAVVQQGTGLVWHGHYVGVDAPCAGIHMLWTSLYLASALACLLRLSSQRTILLAALSVVAALGGNVLRTTSLFYLEVFPLRFTHKILLPAWTHEGIGAAIFVLISLTVALASQLLLKDSKRPTPNTPSPGANDGVRDSNARRTGAGDVAACKLLRSDRPCHTGTLDLNQYREEEVSSHDHLSGEEERLCDPAPSSPNVCSASPSEEKASTWHRACGVTTYLSACCLAAIMPFSALIHPENRTTSLSPSCPGWPSQFEGQTLKPVPLTENELRFGREFPGQMAKFSTGTQEILMRFVTKPTRQLHSSQDCLRGLGYEVEQLPCSLDKQRNLWSSFEAIRDHTRLHVRERVYDCQGGSWSDISEWYWKALSGSTRGPWFAVTVASQSDTDKQMPIDIKHQ